MRASMCAHDAGVRKSSGLILLGCIYALVYVYESSVYVCDFLGDGGVGGC